MLLVGSVVICFLRPTYEHTARHVTDWHTEATHAGVSVAVPGFKMTATLCKVCFMGFSAFLAEVVAASWTELVEVVLGVCRNPVGDVVSAVPEEGVEVVEEEATNSRYQQKNLMLS